MNDFVIIGGGIVGLSTAVALTEKYPRAQITVIEKEDEWAKHQTGRNSGVIHSGIYYKPGSYKARFAREGNQSMIQFCKEHHIDHEICGKVIVATNQEELPLLDHLFERGQANQLQISKLSAEELQEVEPHANGLAAIRVPSAGIVNYKQVCLAFASILEEKGVRLCLNTMVKKITNKGKEMAIDSQHETFKTHFLINCAGLHSDRIARMAGKKTEMKIIPFRGEYFELKPDKEHLVKNLIYPVPNPQFPFLGVHFTRMIEGGVEVGPNAVLSLKREGYTKLNINPRDVAEVITYPGFWKLARTYWREGMGEMVRSLSKTAFVKSMQRLIPDIQKGDIEPAPAGVRAQALMVNGKLVDDFHIVSDEQSLHVCNAPSPAATASIQIGKEVVHQIPKMDHLSK